MTGTKRPKAALHHGQLAVRSEKSQIEALNPHPTIDMLSIDYVASGTPCRFCSIAG